MTGTQGMPQMRQPHQVGLPPHARRRGLFQEIAAVVLGLLIPIVLILGGYYFLSPRPEESEATAAAGRPTPPTPPPAADPPTTTQPSRPSLLAGVERPPEAFPQPAIAAGRGPADPVYPSRAVIKPFPGDVGDFYLQAPDEGRVKKGDEFTVELIMNSGDSLIAATTIFVHFDPLVLEFQSIKGSLTKGSSGPLATNMKSPGVLVISDINAPSTPKPGQSPYNQEMRGSPVVYRVQFTAAGNPGERSMLGGGSTVFHDPGTDPTAPSNTPTAPPTQIGDQPFPRPATSNVTEIVIQ